MWWKWLIFKGIKILMTLALFMVGIWYVVSSLNGGGVSYVSIDTFTQLLNSGSQGRCDSGVPGCFLCCYISELFRVMGEATEKFWNGIVTNLWIVMAIGFGIFLIMHTITMLRDQATSKDVKDLTDKEPKLEFGKWFDKVWKTGLRVLIAGALIGALNWSGTGALRAVTNVIVTPVMYTGSVLSMAATDVISHVKCDMTATPQSKGDVLTPVLQPFMCVMNNLNTVMLAGAGGGIALMDYAFMSWEDQPWLNNTPILMLFRAGNLTYIAGLGLIAIFLIIGFNLLFQVLTVVFKLIFIVIFMPLLLGAYAFEQVWGLAKGFTGSALKILIESAISIIRICLKISIIYAIVFFSADTFYPGPQDGFTTILPPLSGEIIPENLDPQAISVREVFSICEQESLVDSKVDRQLFKECFERESAKYPGAFDFMTQGFDFLLFMIGICLLYFFVVSPKIDNLLTAKDDKEVFDYGQWVKDIGKSIYEAPEKIYSGVKKIIEKGK